MKTHILCSITFFRKSHRLRDNVEKCRGDRGATNDVTIRRIRVACWFSKAACTYAHAHVHVLGYPRAHTLKQAYTHRRICNTSCFSAATIVSWTRLSVTLYVHCLSCFVCLGLRSTYRHVFLPFVALGTNRICWREHICVNHDAEYGVLQFRAVPSEKPRHSQKSLCIYLFTSYFVDSSSSPYGSKYKTCQ